MSASRQVDVGSADPRVFPGPGEVHLRTIAELFPVRLSARGGTITVEGEERDVDLACTLLADLVGQAARLGSMDEQAVRYAAEMVKANGTAPHGDLVESALDIDTTTGPVRARTLGQRAYVEAMEQNDITFSIGPAGTGKTYLAVAKAVEMLRNRAVTRIVLTRPAVEAGESLGFLPGDVRAKVDPYLRPLYDALHDMLPPDRIRRALELGVIEIAPLAFMRGRTLNRAFVILDEAQNSSSLQMKMFLTRLGEYSRAVITGDVTQIDLPEPEHSGLVIAEKILHGIRGIGFVWLTDRDVVRHRLVKDVLKAYDRLRRAQPPRRGRRRA